MDYLKKENSQIFIVKLCCSIMLLAVTFHSKPRHIQINSLGLRGKPFIQKESSSKRANIGKSGTQPFSVSYVRRGMKIDPLENENFYVSISKKIEIEVDSPEYEIAYKKQCDSMESSMKKSRIPVSHMMPHTTPSFHTTKKIFPIDTIDKISISKANHYNQGNISFNNERQDTVSHNIDIFSNNINITGGLFFHSSLDLYCSNIILRRCNFNNSYLNLHCNRMEMNDCELDSCTISMSGDTLFFNAITIVSRNNIGTFNYCKLEQITGDGILELNPNNILPNDKRRIIQDYVSNYGDTKGIEKMFKTATVVLNNVDVTRLKFNPKNILFIVDSNQEYGTRLSIYRQLIDHFKDDNEERKIYDIEYNKLIANHEKNLWFYFKDRCMEIWDNYGYEPNRILNIIVKAFVFFFAVNLLIYPYILMQGYEIPNFKTAYEKVRLYWFLKKILFEIVYSFLYTALLFWVFRLDLSRLKVHNLLLTCWIVFQHVISLILIAFLVRAIIK